MVVHHDDFIDLAVPLLGEHADGRRAASHPHALFGHAVDDGRIAGLHHHGGAAVDRQFDRLAVAEIHQRVAGDAAFLLRAAGEVMHAAERQHLRTVFARGDVADRLALRANRRRLRTEVTVGVDLHLDAAIAEDALGHHGDHVDAVDLRGDDERRRLVVGVSGAGADRGDEDIGLVNQLAVPVAAGLERHQPSAMRHRSFQHDMGIDAHQLAIVIGIAVAGACRTGLDVAHDRTSIAADLVVGSACRFSQHEQALEASVRLSDGQVRCGVSSTELRQRTCRVSRRWPSCSYTNDVARAAESCQAPRPAKTAAADKNRSLPRRLVHKPGNGFDQA